MNGRTAFVGRQNEIDQLNALLGKKQASLVVVKGRRRVGKSRLVQEFAQQKRFYKFVGLAPHPGIDAQDQRDAFAKKLAQYTGLPVVKTDDWSDLFTLLAREVRSGRVIVSLDEISWMAMGDDTFLPKLKNAWDDEFLNNSKLILIICSSISTWIEKNILNSKAFYGRVSWTVSLGLLPLNHCNEMLEAQGFKTSVYEKFKVLSVTGGVPWYIEQIQGDYTADDNIKRQCFSEGGVLYNEYDIIFNDLFEKRSSIYKPIVEVLIDSPLELKEIAEKLNYPLGGRLSNYMDDLIEAGFVTRDHTWSLKTRAESKLSKYRLSDNYLRFYLKFIRPKINQVKSHHIKQVNVAQLPGWDGIMGLQFENLVLNNRHNIHTALSLNSENIEYDNPFYQRKTARQKGCQIDYLIQTRLQTLYVCEIKFSKNALTGKVCETVAEKIKRLSLPRNFRCLPVLIHINGVSQATLESNYFYKIIDFSEFLLEP